MRKAGTSMTGLSGVVVSPNGQGPLWSDEFESLVQPVRKRIAAAYLQLDCEGNA
jgi:hypothetical protein